MKNRGITQVTGGIIIAVITVAGSYFVADKTASSKTDDTLNDFKLQTTKDVTVVQGQVDTLKATVAGDVNTMNALTSQINEHLNRIDKNVDTLTGSVQSLTSRVLNDR